MLLLAFFLGLLLIAGLSDFEAILIFFFALVHIYFISLHRVHKIISLKFLRAQMEASHTLA